jgi:polyhydroxyalkanoate synthesis regulator phasin
MKRLLMLGAVVAALGLAAVALGGAVSSAQGDGGPVGTFFAKVAEKLGVSEEKLNSAVQEAQSEMIDEAVAEGRLTAEQAAQMKERIAEGDLLFPFGGRGGGWHGEAAIPQAAAQVLGMTQDELMQQMADGSSLAEVAEAKGMSLEDFKAALLAQVRSQVDAQVADGKLTQEQADQEYQRIQDNIDGIVSGEVGFGGPGGPGGPGHGPPPEAAPTSTDATG